MTFYIQLTIEVLLAVAFALAIYDIWVGRKGGSGATISWVLWLGAKKWPTIPFAMGYLMGHLFAQMSPSPMVAAARAAYRIVTGGP